MFRTLLALADYLQLTLMAVPEPNKFGYAAYLLGGLWPVVILNLHDADWYAVQSVQINITLPRGI